MPQLTEKLALIIGSRADYRVVQQGLRLLKGMDVPCRALLASALIVDEVRSFVDQADKAGIEVFIVAQGGSATLPGILALSDPAYFALFSQWRERLKNELEAEAKELEQDFGKLNGPATLVELSPVVEISTTAQQSPPASRKVSETPEKCETIQINEANTDKSILFIDPEHPNIEYVEEAVHALLAGKIIALPTDTVYGLAVDATNALAVKHLRELKNRRPDHPLPVMVCNEMQLKRLVQQPPEPVLNRLDDFWPGPLTVVFKKPSGSLSQVSLDDSLGVRIPNHNVTLGILSMINRPLAVTSANPTGEPSGTSAGQIRNYFPEQLALIIDSGPSETNEASTVLDVRDELYKILRDGLTSHERLRELFGRLVE